MVEISFADRIKSLSKDAWKAGTVAIRPIENDDDLWYAVVECRLRPGQEEYVPCVICKSSGERIGYIVLRKWLGEGNAFNWSYYIDGNFQGLGYGKAAARLAVQILKAVDPAMPIKLSTEELNIRAQKLYRSIGFVKAEEKDGDDLVFVF